MTDVRLLLGSFANLRVLVVGDTMLDVYREGTADRLCREGPVPVVRVRKRTDCAGGAANTAVNLRRLGAEVDLVSLVGDDPVGRALGAELDRAGVQGHLAVEPGRESLALQRVVVAGHLVAASTKGPRPPPVPLPSSRCWPTSGGASPAPTP